MANVSLQANSHIQLDTQAEEEHMWQLGGVS